MRIAFVITAPVVFQSNGIRMQAIGWKKELEKMGHEVVLANPWYPEKWEKFDIVQLFGYELNLASKLIDFYAKLNLPVAFAPIIDSKYSTRLFRLATYWGSDKMRLSNAYHGLRKVKESVSMYQVRSEYEMRFLTEAYGIDKSKITLIPLSYRLKSPDTIPKKEPFCLHVSLLLDARKNVKRLIEAAEKYSFKLILGGKLRNIQEEQILRQWVSNSPNTEYVGFLTDDELRSLYLKAKVFALPSTYEGVGMVALDAALLGCDIVITDKGGPKEYYGNLCSTVNPYDTDAIGRSVREFIDGKSFQPKLREHIITKYSPEETTSLLIDSYKKIIQ